MSEAEKGSVDVNTDMTEDEEDLQIGERSFGKQDVDMTENEDSTQEASHQLPTNSVRKRFAFTNCTRSFAAKRTLEHHNCESDLSGNTGFVWDRCSRKSKTSNGRSKHKCKCTPNAQSEFVCEVCSTPYASKRNLNSHVEKAHHAKGSAH